MTNQTDNTTSAKLVKTWLVHFTGRGLPKQAALDILNQRLKRSYGHGHLSRWVRGVREPDAIARGEMLRVVNGRGGSKDTG